MYTMKKRILNCISVGLLTALSAVLLTGCKDYCSYGGCMKEAVSGGRCEIHQGLENDPYYGLPDEMK